MNQVVDFAEPVMDPMPNVAQHSGNFQVLDPCVVRQALRVFGDDLHIGRKVSACIPPKLRFVNLDELELINDAVTDRGTRSMIRSSILQRL